MSEILKKITRTIFNKQAVIFLFFLLLSTIFWLMHSIGTNREISINYPIRYINPPQNLKITNSLPCEVNVSVDNGKKSFLNYLFVKEIKPIIVDLKEINQNIEIGNKTFLIENKITSLVKKDFGQTAKVFNINPKVIVIEYVTLKYKIVPVVLTSEVNVKNNYIISDSISIKPDKVKILGSKKAIDTIQNIIIDNLNLDSLDRTTVVTYSFKNIKYVTVEPQKVKVKILVEKSTQKTLSIPIIIKNAPKGLLMKSFPTYVNIDFIIALSMFNSVKEDDFVAEIDYAQKTSDNKCVVYISKKPDFIKILRLSPQEVEFSLEQIKQK